MDNTERVVAELDHWIAILSGMIHPTPPQAEAPVVRTTHVQRLITNGLDLARRVDGMPITGAVGVQEHQRVVTSANVRSTLLKAAADLRHAAEELTAEALSCDGWSQV